MMVQSIHSQIINTAVPASVKINKPFNIQKQQQLLHQFYGMTTWVAGTKKVKPVWVQMRQEMTGFWDAVASAGPYANNLHLAPDR